MINVVHDSEMSYLVCHPYRMIVRVSMQLNVTRGERSREWQVQGMCKCRAKQLQAKYLSFSRSFPECHTSCMFWLSREPIAH